MNPQAYYDFINGMPLNQLWARYQVYPWRDNQGNRVLLQDRPTIKGPLLPKNVSEAEMPFGQLGTTGRVAPFVGKTSKSYVNEDLYRSGQLRVANHELQHVYQGKNNLPIGPMHKANMPVTEDVLQNYFKSPGEAQARMTESRSAWPESWKAAVHPFFNAFEGDTNLWPIDKNRVLTRARGEYKAAGMPLDNDYTQLEATLSNMLSTQQLAERMVYANEMPQAYKNLQRLVAPNLIEILEQLRNVYIPPFISPGMQ